ncbi:MAG: hypothetical protein KF773_17325 [Deltaproteobacteria bacterium]|nr:hypothetical protein [Deltaproteobacteria bacterium]
MAALLASAPARADDDDTDDAPPDAPEETGQRVESWGAIEPGKGFLLGRTKHGEVYLSAYVLARYLNQMPAGQTFTDHLGRVHEVDPRQDIFAHRIMVHLKGWMGLPQLIYQITFWTVNPTDQKAIFGVLGYQFSKKFSLYAGLNALPGSRSLFGSHPYWLGHDRVMADEFFRPYFTYGAWASGEIISGVNYSAMTGNNNSALDITASQLTRSFAYAGSLWWMPTTQEFGPNGSFDDWEYHQDFAMRFGFSGVSSLEDPFTSTASNTPENTTLRLTDSLNLFAPGSLAEGVTVTRARYSMVSADAGFKYRGIFVGAQFMQRWLTQLRADGPLPMSRIVDKGFYVQASFYPLPKLLQVYGVTSWVFGDTGFPDAHEYIGGANWFFAKNTRDIRLNAQMIWIDRSPVSSSFGYYIGGQKGPTYSLAASILF